MGAKKKPGNELPAKRGNIHPCSLFSIPIYIYKKSKEQWKVLKTLSLLPFFYFCSFQPYHF
jgi:hypothetical protein